MVKRILATAVTVFFCAAFLWAGEEDVKVSVEEVKSNIDSFRRDIEVELPQYKEVAVLLISLRHVQKKRRGEATDYLYVRGTVESSMRTFLSGAVVSAELFDEDGVLLDSAQDAVLPRVIGLKGPRQGHFAVRLQYDPSAVFCRLDVNWSGKELGWGE